MSARSWLKRFFAAVLVYSFAACTGGGGDVADDGNDGGGNPPPPSSDVDLSTEERAALVAALLDLETKASDSGQAQQARVARGAALAIQGGTKMTGVTVTGSPTSPAGLRDASLSGAVWAAGYQLDVLNMSGRTTPLRLHGALARMATGALVLTGGEATSGPIPPAFGVLFVPPSQFWLATAGQASSVPGAEGGACPIALSIPGVGCTLATFRAGFAVEDSTRAPIAGNTATGSQTATLVAGPDLRGVKISIDCAQATPLVSSLVCRWVPQPRLTVAFAGGSSGSVTPTPARDACLSPLAPCSWTFATGTTVELRASTFVSRSFFDGDFSDAGWTLEPLFGGNVGSVSTVQLATGGNPGSARRVTLSPAAAPATTATSSAVAMFWRNDAVHDPRSQGPIASLDFSQDHRAAPGPQFLALAIKQDGKYFLTSNRYADSQSWTRFTENELTPASFTRVSSDLSTQYAEGPDFSATGTPMQFGLYRGASTGYGGGGYTTVADVDNWMVNLRTQGAAVQTPVWTGCNDTAAGGVCYVNLADDRTVSLTFE